MRITSVQLRKGIVIGNGDCRWRIVRVIWISVFLEYLNLSHMDFQDSREREKRNFSKRQDTLLGI